jgi:hypothetical protein
MATEKRRRMPWGAIIWAGVGTALAVRTFYRPARAVVADGYAKACAGRLAGACRQSMLIESFTGAGPVYAPVSGRVLASGQLRGATVVGAQPHTILRIAAAHEPVILEYAGALRPQVQEGEQVGAGQQIALASELAFGVTELRSDGQQVAEVALEPASWLAARGLRISQKAHAADAEGPNWCEGGRKLVVPESAGLCDLELPPPGGLMLLPVSVTMQRGA